MADVKWIKITTDIFNDEKMMLIEYMPDSDSLIVIWFKLLALAGKTNNGGLVMISEKVPYTEEMLAVIFRRKQTVVKLALDTFESFGMIERVDNKILISNWEKHQNVKGLDTIREQRKLRQQKYRDNQKTLLLENKKEDKEEERDIEGHVTRNVTKPPSKSKRFIKPTIDDIQKYCTERKNNIDANNFYDFYESKGWSVGTSRMKDWKAAVRTWENRNNKDSKPNRQDIKDIKDDYITYIPDSEANNGPFKVGKN